MASKNTNPKMQTQEESIVTPNRVIILIALLGIVLTLFLWSIHFKGTQNVDPFIPCTPNGGCEEVLTSKYSKMFGVPVAIFGLFYYLYILLISFQREFIKHTLLNNLLTTGIIWGFIYTIYLRYLDIFVIRSICIWCLISAGLIVLLGIVRLYEYKTLKPKSKK